MQEKSSVALSGKNATKLLEGLTKDPQLRADDDPSIMLEEQQTSLSSSSDCSEKGLFRERLFRERLFEGNIVDCNQSSWTVINQRTARRLHDIPQRKGHPFLHRRPLTTVFPTHHPKSLPALTLHFWAKTTRMTLTFNIWKYEKS
jgi:hypothetical protein